MSDYEELDSFTENIVRRTLERQKLLSEDIETKDSFGLTSNVSKTSLKNERTLSLDNKSNIMSENQITSKISDSSRQLINNLINISPDKKRVPLSQRLSSIARSYGCEDSENFDYIDSEANEMTDRKAVVSEKEAKSESMRKLQTIEESPPKKRLLLNERLSQIARSYYPSNDLDSNDNEVVDNNDATAVVEPNPNENKSSLSESSLKKRVLLSGEKTNKSSDVNSDLIERKSSISESPLKKRILLSDEKNDKKSNELNSDPIESKTLINASPVKKLIIFGETRNQVNDYKIKTITDESLPSSGNSNLFNASPVKKQAEPSNQNQNKDSFGEPNKLIFNSKDNAKQVIKSSSNVSEVRKIFESKPKSQNPENLSLRAKTDLFEKVILAENEAKSKQYVRKRMAPQMKPIGDQNSNALNSNKKGQLIVTQSSTDESSIKRSKSSEKLSPSKANVSNNILMKKQILQQRLFGTETTTATSVMKDIENRKKELEILKRPMKMDEQAVDDATQDYQNTSQESEEYIPQNSEDERENDEIDHNIDNETAHQTVCEAFEEIENYSVEPSEEEVFHEEVNKYIETQKSSISLKVDFDSNQSLSESPSKKNKLYPDLTALEETDGFHETSSYVASPPPAKPPRLSEQDCGPSTPMRTISFYRREQSQKSNNTTPATQTVVLKDKQIERENQIQYENRNRKIQERIDQLREEVEQHNRIAGQASQALNLCLETNEFKGSTEHVEAERLLLVSGQKRIACLNEISKLKIALSDKSFDANTTKGCLSLYNIQLLIKGEFLVARAKAAVGEIHHFICLIYNGANVIVTDLLSSENDIKNGKLDFSCGVYLPELSSDFQIVIHVYDLITAKHQLPHDIKYHIKKTPKKKASSMKSPTVRSPGGPNAVLSTSFSLVGVVNINLSNYKKKSYKLDNFCYTCPLEGTLTAQTELKVEHNYNKQAFFDIRDKSGFWNLRWLVLRGHQLAFYRFPEDVNKKPLGLIDLKECINPNVSILPSSMKHICMRPNTIALITISNTPKNVFTKGGTIPKSHPIKYLISAENKDNCIEWCEQMTTVLNNIRLWDNDSSKPYTPEEFERLLTSLD